MTSEQQRELAYRKERLAFWQGIIADFQQHASYEQSEINRLEAIDGRGTGGSVLEGVLGGAANEVRSS